MESLSVSDMAFIRPSPARGSLGGVAQHTRETMLLCEAAGFGTILVETVGVGQSETAVHDMVDFFLLITLAGAGDELQGMKRGIMELADIVAVNKADGGNTIAAEKARRETESALHYLPRSASGWTPCAVTCSAQSGSGIVELWQSVLAYVELTRANGWFNRARQQQEHRWMHAMIRQGLIQQFESHRAIRDRQAALEQEVLEGRITSFRAARSLLETYFHTEQKEILR
jgi:LAO/AO transport system kinase